MKPQRDKVVEGRWRKRSRRQRRWGGGRARKDGDPEGRGRARLQGDWVGGSVWCCRRRPVRALSAQR